MLEKLPYRPVKPPVNEEANLWIPKFLHRDTSNPPNITISDDFYGTRRKLRLGILGAGLTCMNFLHFLQESIPAESVEIVVYEKNGDVGGVVSEVRGAFRQFLVLNIPLSGFQTDTQVVGVTFRESGISFHGDRISGPNFILRRLRSRHTSPRLHESMISIDT